MTSAALRLESFGSFAGRNPIPVSATDLEQAYHEGHERGLNEGREASLDALTAELTRMSQALQLLEGDQQRIRQEALSSVAPALALIIDLLGPAGARERLLAALQHELGRLVASGDPGTLRIRCAPDLRPDIQDCVQRAGLRAGFEEGPEASGIELSIDGGTISFDPLRPVAELRSIIDELRTKE